MTPQVETTGTVDGLNGFHHRYSEAGGARVHYVIGGSGPAVVLLHGWPYTWRAWQPSMALLATEFTVIAPDLRGLGDSTPVLNGYDALTVAQDVRLITQAEGFDHINLVGMDIGTMIAFTYAITHPTEVDSLVLSESVVPGFGLEDVMNPATGGFWHFGFHMQADLATMLTEGKEEAYLAPMWHMGTHHRGVSDAYRAELLASYTRPGAMRAGFSHYASMLDSGKYNQATATTLAMPLLIVNGDSGLPQSLLVNGLSDVATSLETAVIPDAGHLYSTDNPDATADTLHTFFGKSRSIRP